MKLAVWENSESAAAVLAIPILYCFSLLCVILCDSHPLFDFTTSQRVSCQEQSRLQRRQTVKGFKVKQPNKIIGQTKQRFFLANFLLDSRESSNMNLETGWTHFHTCDTLNMLVV